MNNVPDILKNVSSGEFDGSFMSLYIGNFPEQRDRYTELLHSFSKEFPSAGNVRLFSSPGRTEMGGNHTDHQNGRVLAAAVTLDITAAASKTGDNLVTIKSHGYNRMRLDCSDLEINQNEKNTSQALIRGILRGMQNAGYKIGGFCAFIDSKVPKGSGLSSSAAFSVLICAILNGLFNNGSIPAIEMAKICQFSENTYFMKPSGLMDQAASACGGLVAIDFEDNSAPKVQQLKFDFTQYGYRLIIVNGRGSHAGLTGEYAKIPADMRLVSDYFGKDLLRQVDEKEFFGQIPKLMQKLPHRAILRALHFFDDNNRVVEQTDALRFGKMEKFLKLVNESGRSSYMYLQNIYPENRRHRNLAVALALSARILKDDGACRVHGGGFAGTIQAFVPDRLVGEYIREMEHCFGENCCYVLDIRPYGGVEVRPDMG